MNTVTTIELQTQLLGLLERLSNGESMIIIRDRKALGQLLPPELPIGVPISGRGKGKISHMINDDEHLKDFEEYM